MSRLFPFSGLLFPPKKSPFLRLAERYFQRLDRQWKRVVFPATRVDQPPIGLLLTPWISTAVPFFVAELALQLRLAGHSVLVLSDLANICGNAANLEENWVIGQLASRLEKVVPVRTVNLVGEEADFSFEQEIFESCVRQAGSEKDALPLLSAEASQMSAAYRQAAAGALRSLPANALRSLVIPGGLWGLGGVYAAIARREHLPFTTFDCGDALLGMARDGAMAHLPDFFDAYVRAAALMERDSGLDAKIREEAECLMAVRRRGDDGFQLQPKTGRKTAEFDVIVPLNYRIDTAAMLVGRAFPDVTTWLRGLLDWATHHPDVRIAIRQHPCEKIPEFRSGEDYSWIEAPERPNVTFIPAGDEVNTYDLYDACKVVLPYTSRSGIEAALVGRHVVVCTKAYFAQCEFVESAATPREYFEKISNALRTPHPPALRSRCALAYYLAEKCTFLETRFTPLPKDMAKWIAISPKHLARDPDVRMIIDGIFGGKNFLFEKFLRLTGVPA